MQGSRQEVLETYRTEVVEDVVELRDILAALTRHWRLWLIVTLLVGLVGGVVSATRHTPVSYTATATLWLHWQGAAESQGAAVPAGGTGQDPSRMAEAVFSSDQALLQSPLVLGRVIDKLHLPDTVASLQNRVAIKRTAAVVTVTAKGDTPEGAASLANGVVDAFLELVPQLGERQDVQVVGRAVPPVQPDPGQGSRPVVNIVVALVLGALLGAGAALFKEYMAPVLTTPKAVERYLGLPVLAQAGGRTSKDLSRRVSTGVQLATGVRTRQVVVIAGCERGDEGRCLKTGEALALAEREAGYRVLCVNVVSGGAAGARGGTTTETVQVPGVDFRVVNLDQGGEVFRTLEEIERFVEEARSSYDRVVVLVPSLTRVAESALWCRVADGVLVVATIGQTRREAALEARQRLDLARAGVLGAVVWLNE